MAVAREITQEAMNRLSAGTLRHVPSQTYTVGDRIEERAAAHPERTFLHQGERRLSYGELNAAANRMAHVARDAGLARGDVVGLVMENRAEFLTTWMGLCKLGVTTALINSNVGGRPLEHALETTAVRHLVVGSECLERLAGRDGDAAARRRLWVLPDPELADALPLPAGAEDLAPRLAAASCENPDPAWRQGLVAGDDLFHIFTSGTTGLPKAARLSHMRWLGVGDGFSSICGYGPDDVLYCVLPLYHGAAGMVVVSCTLAQGASLVLRRRFSASAFWDDVRRYRVTGCQYIGEICRYLLNQPSSPRDRDHSLRVMTGAGLGADIWEAFQSRFGVERILEGWSSTEANTSLINLDNVPGSCGRIPFKELHNGRLVRYDVETDSHPRNERGFFVECETGEVGEFIGAIPDLPDSGAGRFEGYTSKEATERKILRDVFQPGDAWYRSGDLLRQDEDGYFTFVDRIGDTFRWKSENVSTQEVAEELSGFPGLEMANVYGVRVPEHEGRAGMAALLLRDRDAFDGGAFFAWVEARLPRYAQPLFLRLVPEPDLTSTFRLRKVDLQREGYDPRATPDPLLVRDDRARAYLPLSDEVLDRTGLPPFVREPE
jgi:fatty-acyl-CoA synthase